MPSVVDFVGTAAPLTQAGFDAVSSRLGVDAPSLWSLVTVETRGFGFLADRRPKILFERHVFHRRTGGRFSAAHPDISNHTAGGYSRDTAGEYLRLERASALDHQAAIESTSWGLGQVMGFNAVSLGYPSAAEMIVAFMQGEDAQLEGSERFIAGNVSLAKAFRMRDWGRVARFYNGIGYAKNQYDKKLARCHNTYSTKGTPSIELRAAQARLTYLGFDPGAVDGLIGRATRAALTAFQTANALPATGTPDVRTLDALRTAAGV